MSNITAFTLNSASIIKAMMAASLSSWTTSDKPCDASILFGVIESEFLVSDPVDIARCASVSWDAKTCEDIMIVMSGYAQRSESLALSAYHTYSDVTLHNVGVISSYIACTLFLRDNLNAIFADVQAHIKSSVFTVDEFTSAVEAVLCACTWPISPCYQSERVSCNLTDAEKVYWFNRSKSWVQDNGGVAELKGDAEASSTAPYDIFYSFLSALEADDLTA